MKIVDIYVYNFVDMWKTRLQRKEKGAHSLFTFTSLATSLELAFSSLAFVAHP
jgi:hypothetical protein